MSCQHTLDEWTTILHTQFPRLNQPQATVLALWSLGGWPWPARVP